MEKGIASVNHNKTPQEAGTQGSVSKHDRSFLLFLPNQEKMNKCLLLSSLPGPTTSLVALQVSVAIGTGKFPHAGSLRC